MRWLGGCVVLSSLFTACDNTKTETPGSLSVSPELLDFGSVSIDGEAWGEITLSNSGGGPIQLLSLTLTEGDSDIWTADRNGVEEVTGGTESVVRVRFTPEDEGQRYTGRIQVRTDNPDPASFYVSLSGSGGLSDADSDGDGYSAADGDCNDYDSEVHPGAPERCNGADDDCNSIVPGDEADDDGDGWRVCDDDCDDNNGDVNPGRAEVCDGGLDNDCDPSTDEDIDLDGDGFSICDGDCDDNESRSNPSRAEVCDGVDNDCNGGIDDLDADGDGHSACSVGGDCDDADPYAHPVIVAPGGSATATGTEADPYDSVQSGLDHLDNVCRTVVIQPGTYYDVGVIWTGGPSVTLLGSSGDPDDVTLYALQDDRHFALSGGADFVLRDLTLTGGDASGDGGAIRVQGSSVELDQVIVRGNTSSADGGGLAALASSSVRLRGATRFESNVAGDEGGAVAIVASSLDDDDTHYEANAGATGGAVFAVGGDISIVGAELRSNTASVEGGAIAILGAGSYTFERNIIASNTSGDDGGGLVLRDVASASGAIRSNRIQDNTASAGGGAIAVLGTEGAIRIANNTLTGNTATNNGGGVLVSLADGTGLELMANVLHSNDGPAAIHVTAAGATVSHNTAYLTNSGVHFAGDIVDTYGEPLDPTNVVRDPRLNVFSDNGNPDDDDLKLQANSPEIDSGPDLAGFEDRDGSVNDRGYTGGPAAP